jgi:hypothetical protein
VGQCRMRIAEGRRRGGGRRDATFCRVVTTAVSVGLNSESIIRALQRLCEADLQPEVSVVVRAQLKTHRKSTLSLRKGRYLEQTFNKEEFRLFLIEEVCRRAFERKKKATLATAGVATHAGWKADVACETLRTRVATRWTKSTTSAAQELSGGVSRLDGDLRHASESEVMNCARW